MKLPNLLVGCVLVAPAALASTYDAVIVGGGLSGLSAAKELASKNKTYVILEARDRVGGRVYNKPLQHQDGVVEVGAEFVGPTQDTVLALAKELGVGTFSTYNKGDNILWQNNKHKTFPADGLMGAVPPEDPITLLQISQLQSELDKYAKKIDINAPWDFENAEEFDAKSAQDWIDEHHVTKAAEAVLTLALVEIFSAAPADLSLLYVIFYIAAGGTPGNPGTLERFTQVKDGSQMYRIEGGTGLLPENLAKKRGTHNIQLSSPVSSIKRAGKNTNDTYTVTTKSGKKYEGRHVIVAMSPPMADKISFSPTLPRARQQLQKKLKMGSIGKGIGIYKEPFWRKKKYTGQILSDDFAVRASYDSTPKDKSFGAMMGFIQDEQMRALDDASEEELEEAVGSAFRHYFGAEAEQVSEWVFMRWDNEEYSGGGPTANAPVGVLSKYGKALREPVGNLHWAGTESADHWVGYMDGALRAGKRAASEVN